MRSALVRLRSRYLFVILADLFVLMGTLGWGMAAGDLQANGYQALPPRAALSGVRYADPMTATVFLPAVARTSNVCSPIPGASYDSFPVIPPPTDRPAEEHADLNLALRNYGPTSAYLGLVEYGGGTDPGAPQLAGLFGDGRVPAFSAAYQVHHWDWDCNCQGPTITNPDVTLLGMASKPGELVHVPGSGYDIGGGNEVLVLYAEAHRITLKYTGEDNVVWGYTLHLENICVDPDLLAFYQSWNAAGRGQLPALRAGQPFAVAQNSEIGVVIRDTGAFLDPRSEKDWWQ